eukprot:TRINITY_DN29598_c0_g1_i1.p1 TRINITY_DN29598_c0_g1~~TRINITY_DN29598_c0_g1_i1.p1  ORF type:complete len:748 (+),score=231.35 TRINITY_DN29598_c0_g1_i1:38-2245(+)
MPVSPPRPDAPDSTVRGHLPGFVFSGKDAALAAPCGQAVRPPASPSVSPRRAPPSSPPRSASRPLTVHTERQPVSPPLPPPPAAGASNHRWSPQRLKGGTGDRMSAIMAAVQRCRRTGERMVPLDVMDALARCADAVATEASSLRRQLADATAALHATQERLSIADAALSTADDARAAVTSALGAELAALRQELLAERDRSQLRAEMEAQLRTRAEGAEAALRAALREMAAVQQPTVQQPAAAAPAAADDLELTRVDTSPAAPPDTPVAGHPQAAGHPPVSFDMAAYNVRLPEFEATARDAVQRDEARARRRLTRFHRRVAVPFGTEGSLQTAVRGSGDGPVVLCRVGEEASAAGLRPGDLVVRVTTPCGSFPIATCSDYLRAIGPRAHAFEGVGVCVSVVRDEAAIRDWVRELRAWSGAQEHRSGSPWLPRVATIAAKPELTSPTCTMRSRAGSEASFGRRTHSIPLSTSPAARLRSSVHLSPAGGDSGAQQQQSQHQPQQQDRGPPPELVLPPGVRVYDCALRVAPLTEAARENRIRHLQAHGHSRFGRRFSAEVAFGMQSDPRAWAGMVRGALRTVRPASSPASGARDGCRSPEPPPVIDCEVAVKVCRLLGDRMGCTVPDCAAVEECFGSFDEDGTGCIKVPELALLARELLLEAVFGADWQNPRAAAEPLDGDSHPVGPSPSSRAIAAHLPLPHSRGASFTTAATPDDSQRRTPSPVARRAAPQPLTPTV